MTQRMPKVDTALLTMIALGHKPGAPIYSSLFYAAIECERPGCNMGLTVEPDNGTSHYHGSAATFMCAGGDDATED